MQHTFTLIDPNGDDFKTYSKVGALKWVKDHLDWLPRKTEEGYLIRLDDTGDLLTPVEFGKKVLDKKSLLIEEMQDRLELMSYDLETDADNNGKDDYDWWGGRWGRWGHGHGYGRGWGRGWGWHW